MIKYDMRAVELNKGIDKLDMSIEDSHTYERQQILLGDLKIVEDVIEDLRTIL